MDRLRILIENRKLNDCEYLLNSECKYRAIKTSKDQDTPQFLLSVLSKKYFMAQNT